MTRHWQEDRLHKPLEKGPCRLYEFHYPRLLPPSQVLLDDVDRL